MTAYPYLQGTDLRGAHRRKWTDVVKLVGSALAIGKGVPSAAHSNIECAANIPCNTADADGCVSGSYRKIHTKFLKADHPSNPSSESTDPFSDESANGFDMRKLNEVDTATIGETLFPFLSEGDNAVDRFRFKNGPVWVNSLQCVDSTSKIGWCFDIGGNPPTRKLESRLGLQHRSEHMGYCPRALTMLAETDRIMGKITMGSTS